MFAEESATLRHGALIEKKDALPFAIGSRVVAEVGHHFAAKHATKMAEEHQQGSLRIEVALEGIGFEINAEHRSFQERRWNCRGGLLR